MEFLRNYIKEGYLKAVGKLDDFKIILGSSAYFDKGILKEEDLKEINEAIEKQHEKETEQIYTEVNSSEQIEEVVEESAEEIAESAEEPAESEEE